MSSAIRLFILSISIALLTPKIAAQTTPAFSFKFSSNPASLLLNNDNNIIYIDRTNYNIKVSDPAGNFLYEFGHNGTGQQDFYAYNGLALDNAGLLYIADAGSKRIQVFTQQGVYQKTIPLNNTSSDLMGLAFDSHSNLYVLDFWNNMCQILDANGVFVKNFTVGQGSNRPRGLAIDKNDAIYVSTDRKKIEIYNSEGQYIKDFASVDDIPGGLAVTSSGVYAISKTFLYHFLPDGTLAWKLGQDPPTGANDLYSPIAVFVKGKTIYVADPAASYIKVYSGNLVQQITFTTLDSKVYGDQNFELIASATSGLPVSFTSSNTQVLSINGSTAQILAAGDATITAVQTGDDDYHPAASVTRTITINKATQLISFDPLAIKKVNDNSFELNATATSGLSVYFTSSNQNVISINEKVATIVGGGESIVSAHQTGNDNYFPASVVAQLQTVQLLPQTVTFPSIPEKIWGESAFELQAVASSGLPVVYSLTQSSNVIILVGNQAIINAPGTVSITAAQQGNSIYSSASTSQQIVVNKKPQSIFFESIVSKKVGDEPFLVNALATSQLPVSITIDDPTIASVTSSNTISVLKAGQTYIRANQAGDLFYASALEVVHELHVDVILGIDDELDDIRLFPNPCRDFVIVGTSSSPGIVQLFDSLGNSLSVESETLANGTRVDLRQITPGLYFVSFESGSGRKVRRFIKI